MLLGPVLADDLEHWQRMVHVNVLGLMYCTHAALPIMQEQGGGHIVNVSSVAGRTAAAGGPPDNATEWGVGGFSAAMRQGGPKLDRRVTLSEPGLVGTEM